MSDITVIGGGVAGCTISYLLNQEGHDVTILEKSHIGGLLREIEFDSGHHCDSAPHILFFDEETEGEVRELFEEFSRLQFHEFYAKSFPTRNLSEPHDYPVTRSNIAKWDDADRIEEELAAAEGRTDADFFDEYMLKQVGNSLYDRYYKNYTAKHWGIDPSRITGDWFDFKISFPDEEDTFFGGESAYPDEKYTTILNEMIEGGDVRFEGVSGLNTHNGDIDSLRTEQGNEVRSDLFVSTIDPSILVDNADIELNYRSMIILGIRVRLSERPFPSHVSWGYFPNDYEFTRVTDYDFVDQSLDDDEYILTIEFPCFTDEELWSNEQGWFEEYMRSFFDEQGINGEIEESEIRRAPRAYPLPVTEEIEKFETLNSELSEYESMFNLGRVSTYEYIWIKDIVRQAYETADEIQESALTP